MRRFRLVVVFVVRHSATASRHRRQGFPPLPLLGLRSDICVCCDACFKVEHVKCAKLSAAPAPEASWFCTTCAASKAADEERAEQARTGGRKPTSSRNGSRNKLSKKEMVKKALHSKEAHIRLYSETTMGCQKRYAQDGSPPAYRGGPSSR